MTRTPLAQRKLPDYTRANEMANMVSHIVGGALGIVILLSAIFIAVSQRNTWSLISGIAYALSMISLSHAFLLVSFGSCP